MMVLSMPVGRGSVIAAASSHPPTPYPDPLMDDTYINSFSYNENYPLPVQRMWDIVELGTVGDITVDNRAGGGVARRCG
jgi:hypothetical protein